MAPHSSTLAWRIPWTEEPGRLQSMGSLRVRHDWSDFSSSSSMGRLWRFTSLKSDLQFIYWVSQKVCWVLSKNKRHIFHFNQDHCWTMYSLTERTFWPTQYLLNKAPDGSARQGSLCTRLLAPSWTAVLWAASLHTVPGCHLGLQCRVKCFCTLPQSWADGGSRSTLGALVWGTEYKTSTCGPLWACETGLSTKGKKG